MNEWIRRVWCVKLPVIQVLVLVIVQVVGFMVAANLAGLSESPTVQVDSAGIHDERSEINEVESLKPQSKSAVDRKSNSDAIIRQLKTFGLLVLACILNAVAVVFWIRQTPLAGIRLILTVFVCFFMCMTVMPQSDTLLFIGNPGRIVRAAATLGLVVSAFVAIGSVPVFGRWRKKPTVKPEASYSFTDFVTRLSISVLAYVIIYVIFGYFIAWQSPELRNLYGASNQMLGFWERLVTPPVPNRVIPFQMMRGLAWSLICFFMLRVCHGSRVGVAISISLFIAVVMNSQLLLPNPIMSEQVRLLHLVETATSNFLFGMICVWIWTNQYASRSRVATESEISEADESIA